LPTFSPDFNEEIFGRTGAAKLQFDYAFNLNISYTERMKIYTYLRSKEYTIHTIHTCR